MRENKTATQVLQELHNIDLRRRRAEQLCALMLDEIIASNVECDIRGLHDVMMGIFHRNGAYIMTDEDRDIMGLESRDEMGWTYSEKMKSEIDRINALNQLMKAGILAGAKVPE